MDIKLFFEIINGDWDRLPKEKSKVMKIFLSSTFSDTHTERDYLIQNIYPKLREYCKKSYNLDFQILDMRWGISSDVMNTHMATSICLHELDICKNTSAGPNFISMLSHRYGSRGLPTRIVDSEYKILLDELKNENTIDKVFEYTDDDGKSIKLENILETCYEFDSNEIPARYRLKYLDRLFPTMDQKLKKFKDTWWALEEQLGLLLRNLAQTCYRKEIFTQTQFDRYFISVTEKEVFNGILRAPDVNKNVLYFEREIQGLEESIHCNPHLAGKFIDLNNDKTLDKSAKALLEKLKEKIPPKLHSANRFKFTVQWDKENGISLNTHKDYVEQFGNTFYEQVKKMIDRNQVKEFENEKISEMDQELIKEVMDHARFCKDKVSQFHGRQELLKKMQDYILNHKTEPFLVYGNSGCGKTAVLAKLADEINRIVPDPANYSIILRFLGTTPSTSNIYALFRSIVYQMCRIYSYRMDVKEVFAKIKNKSQLAAFFFNFLTDIFTNFPKKKLVIVLDSIDQLQTSDRDLEWMLFSFPSNVRMIYSTIPEIGNNLILKRFNAMSIQEEFIKFTNKGMATFQTMSEPSDKNTLEIKGMNDQLSIEILSDWLIKQKRSVSDLQWNVIKKMLKENQEIFPLYVKLLFDVIVKWASFDTPPVEFTKSLTIDSLIRYVFSCLENDHGKLLFSRSIIYMSSFANGISENEIEDILSLDDDVLYDIFEFHAPPVRKLPSALWSRIKYDLKGYMVEKEVHETRVIYWYHRRFIEVAEAHYISKLKDSVFMNVVDFFNETYKEKPKPYQYNEYVARKNKVQDGQVLEAKRETADQQTTYTDKDGNVRYNLRKINEFPQFIAKLKPNVAFPLVCKYIFFNYEFLMGYLKHRTANDMMAYMQTFQDASSYKLSDEATNAQTHITYFRLLMLQLVYNLIECPSSAGSKIVESLILFKSHMNYVESFIEQHDQEAYKNCSLIVPYQLAEPPASDFIFKYDKHNQPIYKCVFDREADKLFMVLSDRVALFNMSTAKECGSVQIEKPNDPICFLTLYLDTDGNDSSDDEDGDTNLKDLEGGFLLANKNTLWSYTFQGLKVLKKEYHGLEITNVSAINERLALVSLKDVNYCYIYDWRKGEIALRKEFKERIRFATTDSDKSKTFNYPSDTELTITLGFESGAIGHYLLNEKLRQVGKNKGLDSDDIGSVGEEETPDLVQNRVESEIPPSGFDLTTVKTRPLANREDEFFTFACYNDGSLLLSFRNFIHYLKPILHDSSRPTFELVQNKNNTFLFLGSNNHIFILISKSEEFIACKLEYKFIEIQGNFDYGHICHIDDFTGTSVRMTENIDIIGFCRGQLKFYQIILKDDTYQILNIKNLYAHFDYTTYIYQRDNMILTASLDTVMKVYGTKFRLSSEEWTFDKTSNRAMKVSFLNPTRAITQNEDSNLLDIWDLTSGNCSSTIELEESEIVLDHFFDHSRLVVISKETRHSSVANIRGYSLNFDREFKWGFTPKISQTPEFIVKIECGNNFKVLKVSNEEIPRADVELLILNEFKDKEVIEVYIVKYNDLLTKQNTSHPELLSPDGVISTDLYYSPDGLLQNAFTVTALSNILILFVDCYILFANIEKKRIVKTHRITNQKDSMKYFLSPTNLTADTFTKIESIMQTNNFIGLDNLNNLNYVNYNALENSVKIINYDAIEFASFYIYKTQLVAYNKIDSKLIGYDLNKLGTSKAGFKNPSFVVDLNKNFELTDYGVSTDCAHLFIVENKRKLRFYRMKDMKKRAEMSLYSPCIDVICNEEFICLTMEDRRVISYLICDQEESLHKVKKLPSRVWKINEKTDKKIKKIIEQAKAFMGDSSDEEYDDDSVAKEKELMEKLRKSAKKFEYIELFDKALNAKDLKKDWQIQFLKEGNQLTKYESNLISKKKSKFEGKSLDDDGSSTNSEELEAFKKEITLSARPKQELFRNANLSRACLIQ